MLLDEPLSALDLKLRQHMRSKLRTIQRRTGVTFVYITHDQGEALNMSDRVAVMSQGRIEQVANSAEIYDNPATPFLASFSPLLTPGVIIGISTLVFWTALVSQAGLHLAVIGQSSFITAYVMLMVLARMQRFDRTLEEAALDLGASHAQVFRRILMPHLKPAVLAASVLAFLQSFENFNTTLSVRGTQTTLTVYIASKVRAGLTPAVNALGLILIVITVVCAVLYGLYRHHEMRRVEAARAAELGSSPLGSLKVASTSFRNTRARVVAAAPAGD